MPKNFAPDLMADEQPTTPKPDPRPTPPTPTPPAPPAPAPKTESDMMERAWAITPTVEQAEAAAKEKAAKEKTVDPNGNDEV